MNALILAIAVLSAVTWLYLLVGRGGFWRARIAPAIADPARFPTVVAVIPARDEAEGIGRTVASLLGQDYPVPLQVFVVDDHSTDGTADAARRAAAEIGAADRLTIVEGAPLAPGWTGKLWAVAQGLDRAELDRPDADYVLLTDGDIEHAGDNVRRLVARAESAGLDLVSLMVRLNCSSWSERALIPAFVFFFRMLYPFAWVNDPAGATAAAAGGCMLVRRRALAGIGGIGRIREALIDDCALAAAIKREGPIWLGLGDTTVSLRRYPHFGDIWMMIARSAYTQLNRSPLLLLGTVVGMCVTYLAPPLLLFAHGTARILGAASWAAMALAYLPSLRYYRRAPLWAPFLPLIALFYLAATIDSARRHWTGRGGQWKGRIQAGTHGMAAQGPQRGPGISDSRN